MNINDDLDFFSEECIKFTHIRENVPISNNVSAFYCSNKYPSSIQTLNYIDIQEGDWLLENKSNRKYFVDDVKPLNGYGLILHYQTEFAYKDKQKPVAPSIQIGSIVGNAIVGNQTNATINTNCTFSELYSLAESKPADDQARIKKLISRVENAIEDNQPVSKGTFAAYVDIVEKYSDIAKGLGSILMKWLF